MNKVVDLTYGEYRTLFDSMDSGFCIIEMRILPDKPFDYRFLEINKAFEKLTGLSDLKGKWARKIRPAIEEYWFEVYRDVVVKRKPLRFDQFIHGPQNRWYEVYAFPVGEPVQNRLAVVFNDISERKKDYFDLQKSRELFSVIFERSPYGILISSLKQGNIIRVNNAWLNIFKLKPEDVIGKNTIDLNVYANRSDRDRMLERVRKEGRVSNMELPMRQSTGEKIQVLMSVEQINSDGVQALLTTILDITENKKAEKALHASELLFRNLFERHTSIMLVIDQESGNIIDANSAAALFYGYTRKELAKMNISQINKLPEDELIKERKSVTSDRKQYFQFPHLTASGHIKWVEVHSSPIRFHGKTLLFSIINDITVQKRIANELVKSELRFRNIFENAAMGMAIIGQDGKWLQVNNRLSLITGYSPEELTKLTYLDITHPLDREIESIEMNSVWESRNTLYNVEKRYIRKDGKIIWMRVTASPMIDPEGEIDYLIAVIEEITEQKKIQEQIVRANEQLKMTHDFMESVLHIAMHDLRSPVANLHLCIQCIEMESTVEGKEKYFSFFKEIVNKLLITLNDLTAILEFISNKKISSKLINIPETIESVINEQSGISTQENKVHYTCEKSEIRYVKPFLESLLRNLVSNSVKYKCDDRPLDLKITVKPEGVYLLVCVEDNGIGIDLEKHGNSIFGAFERFTDKAEGTGIGLYLVKSIVERNGGYVKIKSKPDEGTSICCYLREYEETSES